MGFERRGFPYSVGVEASCVRLASCRGGVDGGRRVGIDGAEASLRVRDVVFQVLPRLLRSSIAFSSGWRSSCCRASPPDAGGRLVPTYPFPWFNSFIELADVRGRSWRSRRGADRRGQRRRSRPGLRRQRVVFVSLIAELVHPVEIVVGGVV